MGGTVLDKYPWKPTLTSVNPLCISSSKKERIFIYYFHIKYDNGTWTLRVFVCLIMISITLQILLVRQMSIRVI